MPYINDFSDGQILHARDMNNIAMLIEKQYDDLYDIKENVSYNLISQTANIKNPSYKITYNYSTFSGWYACIGNPSVIDMIKFPIKAREGTSINTIYIEVYEMPDIEDLTFDLEYGYNPRPNTWTTVAETIVRLDEPITDSTDYTFVTVNFDETYVNLNNKYLMINIKSDVIFTMGVIENTYEDIPYNPWYAYNTNGSLSACVWIQSGTYDKDSKSVMCLPVEIYSKTVGSQYLEIGTEKNDKFLSLVNESMKNSDMLGSIFDENIIPLYTNIGSQNILENTSSKNVNAPSTFTGVVFPIGVVPSDITSDGIALKIATRSYNGSTESATKCFAYLYSVENIPYTSGSYKWDDLNPTLLRSASIDIDLPPEEETVVNIVWDEPFTNTENKFLMLGYNLDTYNYRCRCNNGDIRDKVVCNSIDGNTYEALDSFYAVFKGEQQSWKPRWSDETSNLWCFINVKKVFELGEQFDQKLAEKLDIYQMNTVPTSEVRLAKQYDLVVGDTFQLFYEGVIKSFSPLIEGILIKCTKGKQYPRYFEFTPTQEDVGTYTLKLFTRNLDGSVISEGSTTLVVHEALTNENTPPNITCLAFGDSLTSSGIWFSEGLRRIYGASDSEASGPTALGLTNTCTTYGTKTNTNNTFKVHHEGYGGWTWASFLSTGGTSSTTNGIIVTLGSAHGYEINTVQKSVWIDNNGLNWELEDLPSETTIKFNRGTGNDLKQSEITLPTSLTCETLSLSITPSSIIWESANPFYDEELGDVSFATHATEHQISSPDIVSCLLTWNGGGGTLNFDNTTKIETHINNATTLLRKIHTDFPNAKIICMGIQINSLTGGTGYNYGANGTYADMWGTAFYAFDYNKALEDLVTNDEFGEYCYYVDTKGQFDTINNMPLVEKQVNTRNSNIEKIGNNGVHPSQAGYYQIGDAFYRALTKVIPMFKAE